MNETDPPEPTETKPPKAEPKSGTIEISPDQILGDGESLPEPKESAISRIMQEMGGGEIPDEREEPTSEYHPETRSPLRDKYGNPPIKKFHKVNLDGSFKTSKRTGQLILKPGWSAKAAKEFSQKSEPEKQEFLKSNSTPNEIPLESGEKEANDESTRLAKAESTAEFYTTLNDRACAYTYKKPLTPDEKKQSNFWLAKQFYESGTPEPPTWAMVAFVLVAPHVARFAEMEPERKKTLGTKLKILWLKMNDGKKKSKKNKSGSETSDNPQGQET